MRGRKASFTNRESFFATHCVATFKVLAPKGGAVVILNRILR